ncbi:hypothetical protein ACIRJM_45220 [Streptomyces sp. NPDC102405]|uniref:hypothetical protein n=1 Tax=Streptomyces sp. NPDC102405 TaxID=3366170 RepID=UPI0038044A0F
MTHGDVEQPDEIPDGHLLRVEGAQALRQLAHGRAEDAGVALGCLAAFLDPSGLVQPVQVPVPRLRALPPPEPCRCLPDRHRVKL